MPSRSTSPNGHSESTPLLGANGDSTSYSGVAAATNGEAVAPNGPVSNGEVNGDVEAVKTEPENRPQLRYIVPALSLGIFLSAADQTIIVASYGRIGSDLNALNLTSWIATAYFLTLTSFQPLYGKLSDIFGRKACLLFGYLVFGLGNLWCGLAADINQLIAARVFQGVGGGAMTTVVSIIMSDIVPLKERGVWQGIINIIYAMGAGIGAPLGGILCDSIGWRWAFLAQAPLCLVAFIAVYSFLQVSEAEDSHWKDKLKRIDVIGAITLVCAIVGLLLGLDRGSNVSWSLPITYGSLIASAVFFVVFVFVELYVASEPFAPGHIIFSKDLVACYLCNFFAFGGWLAALFYIPLFFQAVDGVSAGEAGLRLLSCILSGVSGSLLSGIYMKKVGTYYWITFYGYLLCTCGLIVIVLCAGTVVHSTPGMIVGTVMCAFGNGTGVTTTLIGLIANASAADQAVVTACSYLFRSLGSVVGLAFVSTVIQQSLRDALREGLSSSGDIDAIVDGVRQSLEYIKTLEPGTRLIVRECYGIATRNGFAFMTGVVFCAFLSSIWVKEAKLSR